MPRKAFVADVSKAAEKKIARIQDVVRGEDDGEVNFIYTPASGPPIEIGLLAIDVPGYPVENSYMIFTRSEGIGKAASDTLATFNQSAHGMEIPELISAIAQSLDRLLATDSRKDPLTVSDDSDDVNMFDDDEEVQDEDDEDTEEEYLPGLEDFEGPGVDRSIRLTTQGVKDLDKRIRKDLRAVRFAGFRFGVLNGMTAESKTSLLSVSLQVAKLGLSEEAMQAWDLEPQQYIVLLIRYFGTYKTFEVIMEEAAKNNSIEYRIGVSNKYKPTIDEALGAFTDNKMGNDDSNGDEANTMSTETSNAGFSLMFISSSLNQFIAEQFVSLMKIRASSGMGWEGAKNFYSDRQGRTSDFTITEDKVYAEDATDKILPDIMLADHLTDSKDKVLSFPLIVAQFAFRYLVRCTEFCLVCHDKIDGEFEAIKPYVCNKPLCLYQYMSLGFGPSVEHEILTQPYVVDLLVSFCYTSAYKRRIREYPTGMSLSVPPVFNMVTPDNPRQYVHASSDPVPVPTTQDTASLHKVQYNQQKHEVSVEDKATPCPVRKGDWVVITALGRSPVHYKVANVLSYPILQLSETAVPQTPSGFTPVALTYMRPSNALNIPATPAVTPPPISAISAQMAIYNQNFDELNDAQKAKTIVMLLETLPPMRELLSHVAFQSRSKIPKLAETVDRISPAALGLLRWIIASNRSCIVQVDRFPGQFDIGFSKSKIKIDQKVSNIGEEWVQFRFAQGAPDKEQRFLNALRKEQANLDEKYPTLFAFHGSPMDNWHSIIRHGLDFKETLHGRAFGHGVYHAQDQNVSVSYARDEFLIWPGSELRATSVMSINEIVNCPKEYASSKPYLVVQHIDWIQCRYLLCRVNRHDEVENNTPTITLPEPPSEVEQDPKYTARSTSHNPIGVPQCAVAISRTFRVKKDEQRPNKKKRTSASSLSEKLVASDEDEVEDLTFLFSDTEGPTVQDKGKGKEASTDGLISTSKEKGKPPTDFIPGSLDAGGLLLLEPPSYATTSAMKSLQRELKSILKTQESTPLHELGWYINPDLINNVYQWIVELHSFDPSLPFAQDMKAAGFTSVVLEMRFGKEYPHSPPFVRVIRPRFLPFTQGGGGHVTGGGAMCMELLTNSGWSAVSTIESVLLQVRMAMMNLEPKPARLENHDKNAQRDYGTGEAMDAYIRACKMHGWEIPKDFQDFGSGGIGSY